MEGGSRTLCHEWRAFGSILKEWVSHLQLEGEAVFQTREKGTHKIRHCEIAETPWESGAIRFASESAMVLRCLAQMRQDEVVSVPVVAHRRAVTVPSVSCLFNLFAHCSPLSCLVPPCRQLLNMFLYFRVPWNVNFCVFVAFWFSVYLNGTRLYILLWFFSFKNVAYLFTY